MTHEEWKCTLPETKCGEWAIVRRRCGNLGEVTVLTHHGSVMADTEQELEWHMPFIREARGRVLIGGLGLGLVTKAVLNKPEVMYATVVEKSAEVIEMVAPSLTVAYGSRYRGEQGDIFDWEPLRGQAWDCAWFDIWNHRNLVTDEEVTRLFQKYRRYVSGYMSCWIYGVCRG